ncbi:YihY/virulence factor BrkB family protein [Jeotgalibacillus proteolyticus]|uniref:YihY/virulence factor BrkB family protein n=1 Tax=Jeotgalibacillus proteolyticus TaxID=2082395 RepID=A0A2S5GHK4_9BACL|nr:YihY/virulence factor BrkB family protein [Jeotgalibacillus proteolyticus]PPA72385.1 YihY/virulence factor BrkB family protein [Jeotgalibacillus proteolyticus]
MAILDRFIYALKRFFKEGYYDQSAQTAYYFMLSIFPFLFMVMSIASFFPINSGDLIAIIEPYAPPSTYRLIESNLTTILDSGQGQVLSISALSAFWLSSMAIQSLVRSLNDAHHIKRKKNFIKGLFSDFFLTIGLIFILPLTILIPIVEKFITRWAEKFIWIPLDWLQYWGVIRWGLGSLVLFVFFWLLYRYLPSRQMTWKSVIPGALFVTIGWQLISEGFSFYVGYGNYTLLYGQLGSVIVLLIWFYLTAVILLFGGLLNAYSKEDRQS